MTVRLVGLSEVYRDLRYVFQSLRRRQDHVVTFKVWIVYMSLITLSSAMWFSFLSPGY
jgi:hypothetical protein